MMLIAAGAGVFGATFVAFWMCLPDSEGRIHRLTNTEWEPYVAVVFCAGFALGVTMILSGIIQN